MKKAIMITTNLQAINECIERNQKYLEKKEHFEIKKSELQEPNTFTLYVTDEKISD